MRSTPPNPPPRFRRPRQFGRVAALSIALLAFARTAPAAPPAAESHWSFQPLNQPAIPNGKEPGDRNPIDAFVRTRLRSAGLEAAPEAGRRTLIRRLFLDLHGLPPDPERVERFMADRDPAAYSRLVEELLASPRHGERWAQHWLDVVRYADTHGFEVNTERPNAWPYRDHVIRAFNADTPYDRFIREQIAGDALGADAATGFLVTASVLLPGQIGKDEPSKRLARQDALDEIVVNLSQTFLGLSVGCARCHDHKFDPISARDYFGMQAFVAGVEYADRELITPEVLAARRQSGEAREQLAELDRQLARFVPLAGSGVKRPPVNSRENIDRFAPVTTTRVRFTIQATMSDNLHEPCLDELEIFNVAGENVALAGGGTRVTSSGDKVAANRHELRFLNDGQYGNSRSWMSNEKGRGWVRLEFARPQTIDRVVWGRDRTGQFKDRLAVDYAIEAEDEAGAWRTVAGSSDRQAFDPARNQPAEISLAGLNPEEARAAEPLLKTRARLAAMIKEADNAQRIFAGAFREPDVIRLLNRGDPEQPKDVITPAVPDALGNLKLPAGTGEQQRRLALADWIASPRNPLTARVMANRVWQGHFGAGLVETASDFGVSGARPSHPELLDWLAGEFIRAGWSVKHLHRLIVLSATYRQSSKAGDRPSTGETDSDNRLLGHFPARRLEAEAIRDSILAISGRLNLKMHGRGYDLFDKRGGLTGFNPVEIFTGDGLRRMIYAHKVRREREAVFGAFDAPDAGQSTARRRESTTPIQALNLFNSRFILDQSEAFAGRVRAEAGGEIRRQIRRAYQLALHRDPVPDELTDAEPVVRAHGLASLGRALFNSNEFLFLP